MPPSRECASTKKGLRFNLRIKAQIGKPHHRLIGRGDSANPSRDESDCSNWRE